MAEGSTYALITGASRGIGEALARECASRGINLLLVARDKQRLEEVAGELKGQFNVLAESFPVDLSRPDAAGSVWDWCRENNFRVNILVNNAGIGGRPTPFSESSTAHTENRIDLNIRAMVHLTRLFLPELKSHVKSHILNIGSLSAYLPSPYKAVYSATKAFVYHFSRALTEELRGSPVSVTLVNPGGVNTNSGMGDRIAAHSNISVRLLILNKERIARISINKMLKGKSVVVPGFFNRILVIYSRISCRNLREKRTARVFLREISNERKT